MADGLDHFHHHLRGRRILITGGAGFIGFALSRRLVEANEVFAFDNLHPQVHPDRTERRKELRKAGIALIEGDMRDPAAIARAFAHARPEIIYHLAAETGTGQSHFAFHRHVEVNVVGTANLLEAIKRAASSPERIILASSRAVYGQGAMVDRDGKPALAAPRKRKMLEVGCFDVFGLDGQRLVGKPSSARDCPSRPVSIYGSTKLMQEHLLGQGLWGTDTDCTILRLQNVYGPGQSLSNPYTGVLAIFTRQMIEQKPIELYEDGRITRDFVHVRDVVRALALAGASIVPAHPLDIGSGKDTTLASLVRLLGHVTGIKAHCRVSGKFQPGDVRHAVADITAAKQYLGWAPSISLAEGMAGLVAWVRETLPALHPDADPSPVSFPLPETGDAPCLTDRFSPSGIVTSQPCGVAGRP